MGGEQLSGACITHHTESPRSKTYILKHDCPGIYIGIAGDLAQNPIPMAYIGKYHRRPQLRLRQVRKGKSTKTAMPAAGVATPRPPQADSSPQRGPLHSTRLFQACWCLVPRLRS